MVSPLQDVVVLESSLLEAGAAGQLLAGLGATVVKVEAPRAGDSARSVGWPYVVGTSLLHWHLNQGKRSIAIDLKKPEGIATYKALVEHAHVVIDAMRAGVLARLGLDFESLRSINPALVYCSLSGFGGSGPYRDMPSHGLGFDAWAGVTPPATDPETGFVHIPDAPLIGCRVGPVWAAFAIVSAVLRARATGEGAHIDIAQSDAAAYTNWIVVEGLKAHQRPESEVTGNPADGGVRRPPGLSGSKDAVRYQYYKSADGHVLLMASERAFWKNFCTAVDRYELFEANPGLEYGDHALGNVTLRRDLQDIFLTRTTAGWVQFGVEANVPIAPVHSGHTLLDDPQFVDRFTWQRTTENGADLLTLPIHWQGEPLTTPTTAPAVGEHTVATLASFGMSPDAIERLLAEGVVAQTGNAITR